MGWTKRNLVTQAFEEVGLAEYVFDLTPEQIQGALRRLDALMATWEELGIRVGYPLPGSPGSSDIDQETGVPDSAAEAIYTNLALRVAPGFGKAPSPETKLAARLSYLALLKKAVGVPNERQLDDALPRGQGNKPWRTDQPYLDQTVDPLQVGAGSDLDLE